MSGWLLHLSDPHLGDVSPGQELVDEKERLEAQRDVETTQSVFERTLRKLGWFVEKHGKPDVVVVSGDLTYRAGPTGFDRFAKLLRDRADLLPRRKQIVVVPGNHDVVWNEAPGTRPRYARFVRATQNCVRPLLDGVDFDASTGKLGPRVNKRLRVAETEDFVVIPVNTSNYCGAYADRSGSWTRADWEKQLGNLRIAKEALKQVDRLRQHDMARVSRSQVEALGELLENLGLDAHDGRVRIAVLHHQLLPVSTREERKAFESLVNLGLVRQMLSELSIDVVLHGHKHEAAMFWDSVRRAGEPLGCPARRMLVVASPGQFRENEPTMRALMVSGSSTARNMSIVTFAGAGSHSQRTRVVDTESVPLWSSAMEREVPEPLVVSGSSAHAAYARLRALFELDPGRPRRNLVCEVADPTDAGVIPPTYPRIAADDKQAWFDDLVTWWQLDRSRLVTRDIVAFNHGERIYRRWKDQVDRAARMLNARADSSRALIELVTPGETGRYEDDERDVAEGSFPAFVLAEFTLNERDGVRCLDCTAYFRKQEMQYWWPVNLAELARLQGAVMKKVEGKVGRGHIVTLAAIALWDKKVPGVAVPEADRLIEDRNRLWEMAVAVAFPAGASAGARREWDRLLADLAAEDRERPPVPRIGPGWLLDEIQRLVPLAGSSELVAVRDALETLCEQYRSRTGKLNASAANLVRRDVAALKQAVDAALPLEAVGTVT